MPNAEKNNNVMHWVNIAITVILMFGFRFLPAPEPITPYGMAIIGIFAGMIYGWMISASNLVWPSMLAMAALATTEYGGGMAVMTNAFANSNVMMNVAVGFVMGPVAAAGIGDYLMAKLINWKMIQGKPWLITGTILFGIYALGMIGINQMLLVLGKRKHFSPLLYRARPFSMAFKGMMWLLRSSR